MVFKIYTFLFLKFYIYSASLFFCYITVSFKLVVSSCHCRGTYFKFCCKFSYRSKFSFEFSFFYFPFQLRIELQIYSSTFFNFNQFFHLLFSPKNYFLTLLCQSTCVYSAPSHHFNINIIIWNYNVHCLPAVYSNITAYPFH